MCEVTNKNFTLCYPKIKESLEKSKFLAIDLEYSALQPAKQNVSSLFDNNTERYTKLRINLEHVIPLQIGITTFHFNSDTNEYFGDVYTFYVSPVSFGQFDKSFFFQASCMKFLCLHNFDFNKFAYSGIPYLNAIQETNLKRQIENQFFLDNKSYLDSDVLKSLFLYKRIISQWYEKCSIGEMLEIPDFKKYENFREIQYLLQKILRLHFKYLRTIVKDDILYVQKLNQDDELLKDKTLDEEFIESLLGFRKIFKLLTSYQKPIVGHNLLQDLMLLINNFEMPLPWTYFQFKKLTNHLFPTIFDTKAIFYSVRNDIPKEKWADDTSLEGLFSYFKDGVGRHLIKHSPAITCNIPPENYAKYHDAGWDSYCTGYIFLRLGYLKVGLQYPQNKTFVSSEIIGGMLQYKNCVNVIRGSTMFIRTDGDDPNSTRPPWLIIESTKNEPLDISEVVTLLSPFGSIDIKDFSSYDNRVLIAVDNFRTARQISNNFKTNEKFKVVKYNSFRHNPAVKRLLLTALTISGGLLVWTVVRQ